MQKRNGEILRKQIENNNKRKTKKNGMNITEFSLNKTTLLVSLDSIFININYFFYLNYNNKYHYIIIK